MLTTDGADITDKEEGVFLFRPFSAPSAPLREKIRIMELRQDQGGENLELISGKVVFLRYKFMVSRLAI
jgi:hypothetical protein